MYDAKTLDSVGIKLKSSKPTLPSWFFSVLEYNTL